MTQSSQSTELLLANKEMAEVQHKLDRKKEEFDERMVKCVALSFKYVCVQCSAAGGKEFLFLSRIR